MILPSVSYKRNHSILTTSTFTELHVTEQSMSLGWIHMNLPVSPLPFPYCFTWTSDGSLSSAIILPILYNWFTLFTHPFSQQYQWH